jgi:phosphoglycerol transferase MdoB-like AlkP superfamily enzyme
VLTRKHNKGFQTLGGVLKAEGYEPLFVYGGYSYFDNMQDFFGGNGYTVIDRSRLHNSEISHETIWGVADEDLFKMLVREVDARVAADQKVFAHVMTTSNHRPFTYPSGRIDIPSGSGREGAVKYADWAIGKLMQEASNRPWFKDTLFVFIADHTSHARGRTDLPPENFHIPLIIYAPSLLSPGTIDAIASQIDVGPTILALLNVSYTSRFFGQDILTEGQHHQRALMANYLTVGHMEDGVLVELSPKHRARVLDSQTGEQLARDDPRSAASIQETVAHYQVAADILGRR